MQTEIVKKEPKYISLDDIDDGQGFLFGKTPYLKLKKNNFIREDVRGPSYNVALNLFTNQIEHYHQIQVVACDAKVTLIER